MAVCRTCDQEMTTATHCEGGHIASVTSRLLDLGIEREPRLFTVNYCSV